MHWSCRILNTWFYIRISKSFNCNDIFGSFWLYWWVPIGRNICCINKANWYLNLKSISFKQHSQYLFLIVSSQFIIVKFSSKIKIKNTHNICQSWSHGGSKWTTLAWTPGVRWGKGRSGGSVPRQGRGRTGRILLCLPIPLLKVCPT